MVTQQDMERLIANYTGPENTKYAKAVTPEEMGRFRENESRLPKMIAVRKMENDQEHNVNITKGYELIEEMCMISITSMKKTISGRDRVTRTFLYRLAVGLHMEIAEADIYFSLCGGKLNPENPEDYLCIRALEDHDSIYDFCSDYEKYFGRKLTRQ